MACLDDLTSKGGGKSADSGHEKGTGHRFGGGGEGEGTKTRGVKETRGDDGLDDDSTLKREQSA